MIIQEEINQRTVAISVSTAKMTARVLQAAIREYQRQRQNRKLNKQAHVPSYQGKQTIKQLVASDASLSNIEITDKNIKSFEKSAKKYGIDYALKKDTSQEPPKYIVFFKGKDIDVINKAFDDYSKKQLSKKPSVRRALVKMKEKAKDRNKERAHRKEQERSL